MIEKALTNVALPPTVSPTLNTAVALPIAVGQSITQSIICEFAGITTLVTLAAEAPPARAGRKSLRHNDLASIFNV